MPIINVNDINIYHEVHGEGFPLVMIMGQSGNVDWWDPSLIDILSKNFKTIIFDNRGVGQTNDMDEDYTFKTLADDTIGLMDALNIKQAHVFGLSMGGQIAQEIAISYPNRVKKLILCSTMCGGYQAVIPSREVIEKVLKGVSDPEEIASLVFTKKFIENNPIELEKIIQIVKKTPISRESALRQDKAGKRFKSFKRLKMIKNTTLIMHGKKDILVVPENGELLENSIPNAKLVYFKHSAHSIYAEEPELFIKILLEFLKEI
ncbi:MAG: alpha/beta fold hydrolase [Promethearchaeota archaeon]